MTIHSRVLCASNMGHVNTSKPGYCSLAGKSTGQKSRPGPDSAYLCACMSPKEIWSLPCCSPGMSLFGKWADWVLRFHLEDKNLEQSTSYLTIPLVFTSARSHTAQMLLHANTLPANEKGCQNLDCYHHNHKGNKIKALPLFTDNLIQYSMS